ncbi:MAG TPA: hypothetical protein VGF45_05155, partial [Polyangia bacterium]
EAPHEPHNLALFRYGGEVRASSYFKDVGSQHHPLFLIDGRNDSSLKEKWASDRADPSPWVELRWREARALSHVVVVHAGKHEEESLTVRDYTIDCLRAAGPDLPGFFGPVIPRESPRRSVWLTPIASP